MNSDRLAGGRTRVQCRAHPPSRRWPRPERAFHRLGNRAAAAAAWLDASTLVALMALAGCTAIPRTPDGNDPDALSGRLSVRVDASDTAGERSLSAAFELQGNADAGRLNLSTPLGSVVAQARWTPGNVVLVTPQGQSTFPDLDALTRDVLGESVPVAALFDWLRGRPWPGATSLPNHEPDAAGFRQLGWTVNLARFDAAWVDAHRDRPPAVTVRAKLDRP